MNFFKEYFNLSKKEERGAIVLIAIILILFALQYLWIYIIPSKTPENLSQFIMPLPADSSGDSGDATIGLTHIHQFSFDPNTIDDKGLSKLGLDKTVIAHII